MLIPDEAGATPEMVRYRRILRSIDEQEGDDVKKAPETLTNWSEWQDLNLRPLRPERSALPG
ncbi:MAG: hypothetical protein QOF22_263 [Bradyrhizobium sp.]|jgi:hypothetical protein|nr:hypothetical protein [Bradyrhizobium sp.]